MFKLWGVLLTALLWASAALGQAVYPPVIPQNGTNLLPLNNTWTGINTYISNLFGNNIDAKFIGDMTFVTPQYCLYSSLVGSPSSNNTVCIDQAIAAACTNNASGNHAGVLMFARGQYYTTGNAIPASCAGLVLSGQHSGPPSEGPGTGGTTIVSDNACATPIFNFYTDYTPVSFAPYIQGGGVVNMTFMNNSGSDPFGATSCKKPLIRADHSQMFVAQNLYGWQVYQLIQINAGHKGLINNIFTDQGLQDSPGVIEITGSGALPDGTGQLHRVDQFQLSNVFIWGNESPQVAHALPIGLYIHGLVASIKGYNTEFEFSSTALKIDCTPTAGGVAATDITACPQYNVFYNLEAESAGPNGTNQVDITDSYNNTLDAPYLAAFGSGVANQFGINNNIRVYNTTFTRTGLLTIRGAFQINNARGSCIDYEAAQLVMSDSHVWGCNLDHNANVADLVLGAPAAKYFGANKVHDNTFCLDNGGGSTGFEDGTAFVAGTDYDDFHNNTLKGCIAGLIGTPGAHSISTPNVGP